MTCLRCGRKGPPNRARGLCSTCYQNCREDGTLHEYPRQQTTRAIVLEEYECLRASGASITEMAVRLGMSRDAFKQAMLRAKKAGDPRAQNWPPR